MGFTARRDTEGVGRGVPDDEDEDEDEGSEED